MQADQILKELNQLWAELGKEAKGPDSDGVLRACTMTLLAAADDEQAAAAGETLAALMREHPSRSIVLRLKSRETAPFEWRVFAQCWMPFGRRRQICCEQIEISCGMDSLAEASAVIRGLTAPDLPVVLWCASPRLAGAPQLAHLLSLVDKAIFDSASSVPPAQSIQRLGNLARPGLLVADLAWTRLTPWRQLVARLFETHLCLRQAGKLQQVAVSYAGQAAAASALYMGAWLLSSLQGIPRVQVAGTAKGPEARIHEVLFSGPDFRASLQWVGPGAVEVRVNGLAGRLMMPLRGEDACLREELSVLESDPVYMRIWKLAVSIAETK